LISSTDVPKPVISWALAIYLFAKCRYSSLDGRRLYPHSLIEAPRGCPKPVTNITPENFPIYASRLTRPTQIHSAHEVQAIKVMRISGAQKDDPAYFKKRK